MPTCIEHPQIEASEPCESCGRPYCENCLTEFMGRKLCSPCKVRALDTVQGLAERRPLHSLAMLAVLIPTLGYFLCAVFVPITSPIGYYLGSRVVREVDQNGDVRGRSMGLLAMVVSGSTLVLWLAALGVSYSSWAGVARLVR